MDKKVFTTKLLVIFVIESVVIVALILTFQFFTKPSSVPTTVVSGQNQYQSKQTENEVVSNEELQAKMNKILESMEETPKWLPSRINQHLVFQTGDAEGAIMLENPPHNTCSIKCIITADVNGDGKEEKLYDSGLMPINSHILQDVLNIDLDKGEYEATATYTAYSTDNITEIDSVTIPIHISVLG